MRGQSTSLQASGRKSCTRGKEAGLWFFPVFTKSPCPSRNCSQLSRVRRRVGTGDGRMDPRARLRITGAVHRRGRVRGWRGLARVAVPTRGACEPVTAIRPVRCRPNCSADDAFFAGQTVVVGSVRVRSARGVRVHTVHAAHERLWQGVRGVRRLLHRAIVPVG